MSTLRNMLCSLQNILQSVWRSSRSFSFKHFQKAVRKIQTYNITEEGCVCLVALNWRVSVWLQARVCDE